MSTHDPEKLLVQRARKAVYSREYYKKYPQKAGDRAEYNKTYYQDNADRISARKKAYYQKNKQARTAHSAQRHAACYSRFAALKLATGCIDCGYKEHPAALEYDHLPGTIKTNMVGDLIHGSWERLLEEVVKCELVCANCHRVRTANRHQNKAAKQQSALGLSTPGPFQPPETQP
jgi:hypothetical protein